MKACKFYIGESTEPLSYDEMRLYLLNNPELWKSKPKKGKKTINSKKGIINVKKIGYGEGGTKGVFEDEKGGTYKSTIKTHSTFKNDEYVREEGNQTKEYEILKELQKFKKIPRVGEKVTTSEGAAFEIERLEDTDSISIQEFREIAALLNKLNELGYKLADKIQVMRRPNTNELVLVDFSNASKEGKIEVHEYDIHHYAYNSILKLLSPYEREIAKYEMAEMLYKDDIEQEEVVDFLIPKEHGFQYKMKERPFGINTYPKEGFEKHVSSGNRTKDGYFDIIEYSIPLSFEEMDRYSLEYHGRSKNKYELTNRKGDAVQIEETNRVLVQPKAGGGEEVSGTQPEAEPKSTTRNKEVIVAELFESNPELANSVYEALGFEGEKTIETAKGSTYRYLPLGKTQRFKKVEGKEYEPQDILTFVPNYEWIKSNNPQWLEKQGLENDTQYTQYLLEKVQGKGKVWIVDSKGKKIETNQDAKTADKLFIAFAKKDGTVEEFIPVSKEPVIGFYTYDSRIHFDEKGERYRDRHLGNKVVKITEAITPEQKQQAQKLYSQYLDTVSSDGKVNDIDEFKKYLNDYNEEVDIEAQEKRVEVAKKELQIAQKQEKELSKQKSLLDEKIEARGGEKVSGTQPQAEPKSTTRKKEVKPKKEVDESEPIVASLESKAGSTDEVELNAIITEADAIIDKAIEESKRKQVAAKSNAKSANAKAKEIAQKVNEVVGKAASLLHEAYPKTKDGGDINSSDYKDAVELLNKNGVKAVVAKPFDVTPNPYISKGVADIQDIEGVHVEVEVDGKSYSINMANPNMGVDTAKKMPKTVEGSIPTKGFPTAKAQVPSFNQNELLDYVANKENLEQAQKAYDKAKADGDKGSMAAAEKLIKLFTEAKDKGFRNIIFALDRFKDQLTKEEAERYSDLIKNRLTYEAVSQAPKFEDEFNYTVENWNDPMQVAAYNLALNQHNEKVSAKFKDYLKALDEAQKYVDSTIDEKIEADKQVLRDYFKGLSNIGIMRDPMQEALADIKALKALIRIIKNTGIKKKEQIAQMIATKGRNVIPSFDRVFDAAINFINQGLSDTDIDVDMLAEQYKPTPETKGESTKGYEIGKGGEGETKTRGVGKRMLDEEEEFAEFMEYNTLSDEVLSAKALAYMKDRGDSYEAVKKDVTNPNLRIPPALHMALLSNLAKYALQQARKAKTSEELIAWQDEYNELMEGIARLGTEYGQATSYLRNLFKDDAASFVSVMRDLAKRFNKGRMDKFLKTTENIVKTYHAKRKVKVEEAVNSAPVSSQVTQAYNAVKAKNTANAKKASTPQGAKEVAKKQSETNLSKSRRAAIEALKKLKVDVPKNHIYSGAIFLQAWNVAIEGAIKAVEGGFSVAEAIQKAMKAADTEAFKTGSKEDQQRYKNIVRNQIQSELEDKMQDLKKAEEDAVKEFDSLSDSEKQKVVGKIMSETEFRATIQNFIKNYYKTSSGATPDSLASALMRSPEMQALGLEPAQAKNIADAVSAEIQKRLNESVNKAIDSIVAKVVEAKYGDKPLTKEEISALKEKVATMLKKGGNPDLNKVFEEILGMSLPADFDYQMEKMRVMLEKAQTDTAKNTVEQRMADYIENTVKPSRLDYIEDTFFGNMLSGLSSALRNILSLFYNGAFKAMPNSFYNVYKFYEATQGKGLTQAQKWDIMVKTMPLTMYNIVGFWRGMAENAPNALDTVISGQNYDRGFGIEARRLLDRQSLDKAFPNNKPLNVLHKLLLNPVVARYMPRLLMAGDSMIFGAAEEAMTYSEAVRRAQNEAVNKLALGEIKAITTKGVLEDAKALMARTDNQIKSKVAKAEEAYKEAAEAKGLDVDSKDKRVQAQLWVLKKQVVASLIRADNKVKEDAEALERIKNYASHMTFNYRPEGTLGRLARALNKQRNKKNLWGRLLKYFIPFVNIPINWLDQALLQNTPYGMFRFFKGTTSVLGKGRQLDEYEKFQMVFMSMFSAALFANLLFLDDGEDDAIMKITGAGTGDFQKNKELGIEPYTITAFGYSWSYRDSPLAPMFAFIGNMRDVERYGSPVGESIGNLILNKTIKYIVEATWWGNAASFLSIFTPTTANPYRSTTQRLAEDILRKATVPITGQASAVRQTMNQIYELTDTDMRGITSKDKDFLGIPAAFENTLMRSTNFIPVIRDVHDKVYNSLGEPVKVKQSILPLFEAEAGESPESKKIYEIFSGKNGGVGVPQMRPLYNPNDIGAIPEPMDKHEYNEYKRIAGVNTKAELIQYGLDKLYLMDKMYKTAQSGGIEVDEDGYVTIRDAKKRAEFMSLYDKLADIDENVLENYDAYAKSNYAVEALKRIKRRVRSAAYEKIWRERYKVPKSEEMDFGDDESFEKDEEVMLERRGR